jgi:hypothetical protein
MTWLPSEFTLDVLKTIKRNLEVNNSIYKYILVITNIYDYKMF